MRWLVLAKGCGAHLSTNASNFVDREGNQKTEYYYQASALFCPNGRIRSIEQFCREIKDIAEQTLDAVCWHQIHQIVAGRGDNHNFSCMRSMLQVALLSLLTWRAVFDQPKNTNQLGSTVVVDSHNLKWSIHHKNPVHPFTSPTSTEVFIECAMSRRWHE